jgi:uroporphyrinogen decarboxylase
MPADRAHPTGREIIKAVLTFARPPRIGMKLPAPYPDDFVFAARTPRPGERVELPPQGTEQRRWRDEWGCTWASLTGFDKGEVVAPAIADWSQLDDYLPPDLGRAEDYAAAAGRFAADPDRFRVGYLPGFVFNVARYIRKLENYLCDLLLHRDKLDRLHELVRGQLLAAIQRLADAGADAVMFPEDWGTQDRLMIAPALWREVFAPQFRALTPAAHGRGMSVFMHSCGRITDIIPDLIDCGIDCLQFDQPRLHGLDTLAQFAGRVTFWCPVDIQTTLQTRDPVRIAAEARELIATLGGRGGGFIAGYYPSNEAIGLEPQVQDVACRAFVEHGTYH